MIDIKAIFKNKQPDKNKLLSYGFVFNGECFTKDFPIIQGQFTAKITVGAAGEVYYNVYDSQTEEEYVLARVNEATGAFVGTVRNACEEILSEISQNCFNTEYLTGSQTKRILLYIKAKYQAEPEFLWNAFPDFAALRVHGEKTWFALIGKITKNKFGLNEEGTIEFINLKNKPDAVSAYISEGRAYPAYHMNKHCWYSVLLDGRLSDNEIFSRVDVSYSLVNSKE